MKETLLLQDGCYAPVEGEGEEKAQDSDDPTQDLTHAQHTLYHRAPPQLQDGNFSGSTWLGCGIHVSLNIIQMFL